LCGCAMRRGVLCSMKGIGIKGVGQVAPAMAGKAPGMPPWDFNPLLATLTPGMAKRATSVFAAAPIVQGAKDGSGTPDILSYSRGTATIAGTYFYPNFDINQGSISVFWTPEYSSGGIATNYHYFFYISATYYWVYDYTNARHYVSWGGQTLTVASAVVAGTMYKLMLSWDTKNYIDGTNYVRVSINDVHTFGITTAPTLAAPGATIYIGSSGTAFSASAILCGTTIFRRPLYDGAYGISLDAGVTDEVALIAAGIDPCTVTGSFDVCFCLPTNSTPGALVTGAGEAWSHPHSSNLLTRGWLNDRYYGNQWGLRFNGTTTSIVVTGASVDDLPNADCTFEAWVLALSYGELVSGKILRKGIGAVGFELSTHTTGIRGVVHCVGSAADITYAWTPDGKFHHVSMTWTAVTKIIRLYLDGTLVATSAAGVGAYIADAAADLYIGTNSANSATFDGVIGWVRLSNNVRYTTNFVPVRTLPAPDGTTVELWHLDEGTGGTTVAQVTTPANDGIITAGVWEPQWYAEGTPVIDYSVIGSATYRAVLTSAAEISDLADNAFTVEGWARVDKTATVRYLCYKGLPSTNGWYLRVSTGGLLVGVVECANTDATSTSTARVDDGLWHYFKMTFDDAGDRKIDLFVDNTEVVYSVETAGNGAIVADAGVDGAIGHATTGLTGAHGWIRWSNVVRGAGMIERSNPPDPADANTIGQWNANEGVLAVLTDLSGEGNNGAMAGTYTWGITPASETDSPASRAYAWGMKFGNDAADEGIKQTLTGLVAGNDYILRALGYSEEGVGQPEVVVYDEIGAATLVTVTGTVASRGKTPNVLETAFELPALCTSISVKPINTVATGVVGWHQLSLLADLWTDPGFEAGTAVTDVGTPTTSAQSAAQAHTATNSWRITADAIGEGFKRTINVTSGNFYHVSAWVWADTAATTVDMEFANAALQDGITARKTTTVVGAWQRLACVVRATAATMDVQFTGNQAAQTFYVDDVGVVAADNVSLTVTPASAANSVESGGLRVDGLDGAPQPIPANRLFPNSGWSRVRMIPRHSGADALKFGNTFPCIAHWAGDATNYIIVDWAAASTMRLRFRNGVDAERTANWATAGAILAGGSYLLEIIYTPSEMRLIVDGVTRVTLAFTTNFAVVPTQFYPGSQSGIIQQVDAVYLAP
jgi:hypothetical protein